MVNSAKARNEKAILDLQLLESDLINPTDKPVLRQLRTDLRAAAKRGIDREEVKMLVKYYYTFQQDRIRTNNRIKAFETAKGGTPVSCMSAFSSQVEFLEDLMKVPLSTYVENHPVGAWLIERKGIGPVLAAGLLAHLVVKREIAQPGTDVMQTQFFSKVSQWWRFAGYDPTLVWNKGCKRPYNADLKTLCYKVGKSFVMVGKGDIYRELYDRRKEYANAKNNSGGYREAAATILTKIRKNPANFEQEFAASIDSDVGSNHPEDMDDTDNSRKKMISLLERGMITPAAIDAQTRRWTVQMFMSHLHTVMWEVTMGTKAALPYAMAHLNPDQHFEFIPVPGYVTLEQQKTAAYFPKNGIIIAEPKRKLKAA